MPDFTGRVFFIIPKDNLGFLSGCCFSFSVPSMGKKIYICILWRRILFKQINTFGGNLDFIRQSFWHDSMAMHTIQFHRRIWIKLCTDTIKIKPSVVYPKLLSNKWKSQILFRYKPTLKFKIWNVILLCTYNWYLPLGHWCFVFTLPNPNIVIKQFTTLSLGIGK